MISYEQLGDAFHASHLAVPIDLAFSLDVGMTASRAADLLRERNFDQAPVLRDHEVIGFVLRVRLEANPTGTVGDVTTALGAGNIVSADAPVGRLLEWIVDPGFLFVLNGRDFAGFVTVSDFNKQPARAYLYLLLATFETGLSDLMRRRFADEQTTVFDLLGKKAADARTRYLADQRDNIEADPISYLGFSQLLNVVTKDQVMRHWIDISRPEWKTDSGSLVQLRNGVMHPARSLVDKKEGLVRLQILEARLRRLSELVAAALTQLNVETDGPTT